MADIAGYFSDVMKEAREFKAIAVAENQELELLDLTLGQITENQFLLTAQGPGIGRQEKIVGITPKDKDTMDERRFKVLARYNEEIPYTIKKLNEMLAILCGAKGYYLEISNGGFMAKVKVELTSKKNKTAIEEMLERVLPCNMEFTVVLLYNQHKSVCKYTHAALKALKHYEVREGQD